MLLEKPMFWMKPEQLLAPFNCSQIKESFNNDNYFDMTVSSIIARQEGGRRSSSVKAVFGVVKALSRIALLDSGKTESLHFGGYARCDNGYVFEYYDGTARAYNNSTEDTTFEKAPKILMKIDKDFRVEAVVLDEYGTELPYTIRTGKESGNVHTASALVAAIMLNLIKGTWNNGLNLVCSAMNYYYEKLLVAMDLNDDESVAKNCAAISDCFYTLVNGTERLTKIVGSLTPFDPDAYGLTLPLLDRKQIDIDVSSIVGTLDTLNSSYTVKTVKASSEATSLENLKGKWDPHPDRKFDEDAESKIFQPDPWYQIPPMLEYACELYNGSYNKRKKINNFLLCGPSGTGKTEWSKMFSYATNTPIVQFGCSNGTESIDLKVSIIPSNSKKKVNEISLDLPEFFGNMPDLEAIVFDPAGSYEKITGVSKQDATSQECEIALFNAFRNGLETHDNGFEHVKSTLVEAFEKGWIVEIQEPTLMRPAVLASLNMMFDRTEKVQLIDGTFLNRHKDCVVIMTTNLSYEGCMDFNQSVFSRFFPIELELPDDGTLISRLEENTDFHNTGILERMVKVYHAASDLADQQEIRDGAIDFRALEDWAMATAINGRVWDNGVQSFVNKCSLDRAVRGDFIHCLESQFHRGEMVEVA